MGLDMYLHKRTYVKNWSHMKTAERHEVTVKRGGAVVPKEYIDPARIAYVVEEVACWRKANAIHQWFVENVQDGRDDCGDYYVSVERLKDLLDLVTEVLAKTETAKGKVTNGYTFKDGKQEPIQEDGILITNPEVAAELLPTASGFFFGSTDYDQYYLEDLKYTKVVLTEALKAPEDAGSYEYSSSW